MLNFLTIYYLKTNNKMNHSSTASDLIILKKKEQLYSVILYNNGRPDRLAIDLYYDTLRSWYYSNKLQTKGVYCRLKKIAKSYGTTTETIRRKLVKLEKLGLISRSYEHQETVAIKNFNRLVIYVWKKTPYFNNIHGVSREEITQISPHTSAIYLQEKRKVILPQKSMLNLPLEPFITKGIQLSTPSPHGIGVPPPHTEEGTKELNIVRKKERKKEERKKKANIFFQQSREEKERVYSKPISPTNIYQEPRTLAEHYPMSEKTCTELRIRSSRCFTTNAMNEILLNMSTKPKCKDYVFKSDKSFLTYMTTTYKRELRDAVQTQGANYYIKNNHSGEESVIQKQKEKQVDTLFKELEDRSIYDNSDQHRLKVKLINTMEKQQAYNLVSNINFMRLNESTLEFHVYETVEISSFHKDTILSEARYMVDYWGIKSIDFVVTKEPYKETCKQEEYDPYGGEKKAYQLASRPMKSLTTAFKDLDLTKFFRSQETT